MVCITHNAFSYYQFLDAGVTRIAETLDGLKTFPDELAQTRGFMALDFERRVLMRIMLFTAIFIGVDLILKFFYRRVMTLKNSPYQRAETAKTEHETQNARCLQ
tara:strand:- start:8778 stop:9089 length:312 start_codon:yes stop_codon:yes gene_type:complete